MLNRYWRDWTTKLLVYPRLVLVVQHSSVINIIFLPYRKQSQDLLLLNGWHIYHIKECFLNKPNYKISCTDLNNADLKVCISPMHLMWVIKLHLQGTVQFGCIYLVFYSCVICLTCICEKGWLLHVSICSFTSNKNFNGMGLCDGEEYIK